MTYKSTYRHRFTFAAFSILFVSFGAVAQETNWETRLQEGIHAVNTGQYPVAIEILTAVTNEARLFPPNDSRLAMSAWALATAFNYQGQPERAETLYLEAKNVAEMTVPAKPLLLGIILDGLGTLRFNQNRWKEAEELLCSAAQTCERAVGERHACTIAAKRHLADLYLVQGRTAESRTLFQNVISQLRDTPDPPQDLLAGALRGLASVYLSQGQYALAEPLLQEAVERARHFGDSNPIVGDYLLELATLYRIENKPERAEPLLRKAIHIYEEKHDSHLSAALLELGISAIADGKYATAEENLERSLDIWEKTVGKNHLEVATTEAALAQAYIAEHNYKKAEPLVVEALATVRKILGETHCGFAKLLVLAGTLKERQHHTSDADTYYRQALYIYRQNLSPDNPERMAAEHQYARFIKSFKN